MMSAMGLAWVLGLLVLLLIAATAIKYLFLAIHVIALADANSVWGARLRRNSRRHEDLGRPFCGEATIAAPTSAAVGILVRCRPLARTASHQLANRCHPTRVWRPHRPASQAWRAS